MSSILPSVFFYHQYFHLDINMFWSERSRGLNGLAVFFYSVKELFVFPINILDWICSWLFWGYRWGPSPHSFKMSSLKPQSCSRFYSSCFCVSSRSLPDGVCKISKRNIEQALCPARSRWEEPLALTAVFTPNSCHLIQICSHPALIPAAGHRVCWVNTESLFIH